MRRSVIATLAIATLALAACGGGSSGMTATQAGAQVHADAVAAGFASASGLDADAAAFVKMADRMKGQSWPAYTQVDVRDIESRSAQAAKHVANDDVTDALVDSQALNQDLHALAAALQAHGDTNITG